jgi:MFS family permease
MTNPDDVAPRTKPRFPAQHLSIFFITAVLDANLGSILALLAEIRSQFGIDPFGIGLIGGSGFVTAVIAQIGLARLADRGHARVMMIFGLVMAALSLVVLAQADSLWQFVSGRLLLGLGHGTFLPAARRTVIVMAGADAGAALGKLGAAQMTGFLIGPLLGSIIFGFAGLSAVFLLSLSVVAACIPLIGRIKIETGVLPHRKRVLRRLVKRPGMQAMICMAIGYYGSFGLYESIWAIFLSDLGANQWLIGLNLSLFAVPMILFAPLGGRLATRYGAMRMAFVGVAVTIPFIAFYGMFTSAVVLTVVMMVQAIGDALVMPASQLAVAEVSGTDIAAGQGLLGACGLAVAAVVAFAGGAVYSAYGPVLLFAGQAVIMIVTLLGACWLGREQLRSPSSPGAGEEHPSFPPTS